VRAELAHADLVMPSFDACLPDAFERVNLPAGGLTLERYRQGLLDFVRGFHGRVWLEVLLVQGLNDRPQDLEALGGFVASLPPVERVQLNTVVRAPARREARPVTREALEALRARLSEVHPLVEVIGTYRAPEPERPGPYGHGR
jgi:wyosine [tRNA(Phe)-imidazoG37] synthetase (radical SAM superfamily)